MDSWCFTRQIGFFLRCICSPENSFWQKFHFVFSLVLSFVVLEIDELSLVFVLWLKCLLIEIKPFDYFVIKNYLCLKNKHIFRNRRLIITWFKIGSVFYKLDILKNSWLIFTWFKIISFSKNVYIFRKSRLIITWFKILLTSFVNPLLSYVNQSLWTVNYSYE